MKFYDATNDDSFATRICRTVIAVLALAISLTRCMCIPYAPSTGQFITNPTFPTVPLVVTRVGVSTIVLKGQQVEVMSDGSTAPTAQVPVPAGMNAYFHFFGTNGRFLLLDFHTPSSPSLSEFKQVVVDLTGKNPSGNELTRQSKIGTAQLHINTSPSNGLAFFVWYTLGGQAENATVYRSDTGAQLCSAQPFQPRVQPNAVVTSNTVQIRDGASLLNECAIPIGILEVDSPSTPFGTISSTTTATREFTLRNVGTDCCTVSAIASSAHFRVLNFVPGVPIAPNGSQQVTVEFDPRGQPGTFIEALLVTRTPDRGVDRINVSATSRQTQLEVRKLLRPTGDPGRFDLLIDSAVVATNVGNGGSSGSRVVTAGPHTVSDRNLGGATYTTIYGGDCAANGTVTVLAGENKVCTVTSLGAPRLTVSKVLRPATDAGRFDLLIDGVVRAANVGNGGTTGSTVQAIGAHFVSESGGDPRYTTRIAGDCGADGSVSLAAGDDKTCIITNETSFDMADILITSAPDTMPAPSGQGTVTIRVRNSGTTTWQQGPAGNYAVRIGRTGRISLPVKLFVLTDAVAPNEEKTFTFTVLCNGVGLGGFSAQMANPSGTLFDLYAGKNILCQ